MGFMVGLVLGSGLGVQGSGFRVQGFGFWVQGSGIGYQTFGSFSNDQSRSRMFFSLGNSGEPRTVKVRFSVFIAGGIYCSK